MKARKILSVILTAILLLSAQIYVSAQESAPVISYPAEGEKIAGTLSSFTFTAAGGDKYYAFIDGSLVSEGDAETENSVSVSEKLMPGNHTLDVVTVNEEKTQKASVNFSVFDLAQEKIAEFDFTDGKTTSDSGINMAFFGSQVAGTDAEGNQVKTVSKSVKGIDGDGQDEKENDAVGIYVESELDTITINYYTGTYYAVSIPAVSGNLVMEYDLKLDNGCAFDHETKNKSNKTGFIGGQYLFGDNGKIVGTDYAYPKNEWMHVKYVIDTRLADGESKLWQRMWINDDEVFSKAASDSLKNINFIKFQYFVRKKTGPQGVSIDNLKITDEKEINGFYGLSYENTEGEFTDAPTDLIGEETDTVKIVSMIGNYAPTMQDVSVFADNKEITPSSVSSEDGKLKIVFPAPLPNNSEIKVKCNIKAGGNEYTAEKRFRVNIINSFGAENVSFMSDGIRVLSPKQLRQNSTLTAKVYLTNKKDAAQNAVIILQVFDGNRLISKNTKTVSVEAGAENAEFVLETNSKQLTNGRIELYVIDSYRSRMPITKVWKVS